MWRRVRVVLIIGAAGMVGRKLTERLLLHADAILSWAVEGWRAYREHGLSEPAAVLAATKAYQVDSDAVARFVAEACLTSVASTALTRELFIAWEAWATRDGAERFSENSIGSDTPPNVQGAEH